jgi:hypothetical protein
MLDYGLAASNSNLFVEVVLFISELLFVYSWGKASYHTRGVVRGGITKLYNYTIRGSITLGGLGNIRDTREYNRGHSRRSIGSGSYLPAPNGLAPGREEFNILGLIGLGQGGVIAKVKGYRRGSLIYT